MCSYSNCNDFYEASIVSSVYISWLTSKIENRPFGEILSEKYGYALND